jgi:hypothetical protein
MVGLGIEISSYTGKTISQFIETGRPVYSSQMDIKLRALKFHYIIKLRELNEDRLAVELARDGC